MAIDGSIKHYKQFILEVFMTMEQFFESVPPEFHKDLDNFMHQREVSDQFWKAVKSNPKMQRVVIFILETFCDALSPA